MLINIENLCFKYPNSNKNVVENFTLQVEQGERVCILGESGSGKSTVLRLIAGLEVQNSGIIEIDNKIFADDNNFVNTEKRGLGMVFQDYALFPHMTVEKNITFGLRDKTKEEKKNLLSEMLDIIQLKDYANRYPHELSGGQQQRVAIGRALIMKPKVLLMDEPLSNLDTTLKDKIRTEIKNILEKAQITTILVTHDKEDCNILGDYVIELKDGKIVES
jgi:iron(III) transport system ATP-binding protein